MTNNPILALAKPYIPEPGEEPTPLTRKADPVENFPLDALPSLLQGAALDIQKATKAPLGMCAVSVLAVASLAVQGYLDIELPTGEVKPVGLFFMILGVSGERKSTVDKLALKGLRAHYSRLERQTKHEYAQYRIAHDTWTHERSCVLRSKKPRSVKQELLGLLGDEPLAPLNADPIMEIVTVPGMHKHLLNGQPSAGLMTTEGGLLLEGYALNDENRINTAAFLSKLWDAAPVSRTLGGTGTPKFKGGG